MSIGWRRQSQRFEAGAGALRARPAPPCRSLPGRTRDAVPRGECPAAVRTARHEADGRSPARRQSLIPQPQAAHGVDGHGQDFGVGGHPGLADDVDVELEVLPAAAPAGCVRIGRAGESRTSGSAWACRGCGSASMRASDGGHLRAQRHVPSPSCPLNVIELLARSPRRSSRRRAPSGSSGGPSYSPKAVCCARPAARSRRRGCEARGRAGAKSRKPGRRAEGSEAADMDAKITGGGSFPKDKSPRLAQGSLSEHAGPNRIQPYSKGLTPSDLERVAHRVARSRHHDAYRIPASSGRTVHSGLRHLVHAPRW